MIDFYSCFIKGIQYSSIDSINFSSLLCPNISFDLFSTLYSKFISVTTTIIINLSYVQVILREDPYGTETISLPEGVTEGQYLVTVEVAPHEKLQYPDTVVKESDKKSENEGAAKNEKEREEKKEVSASDTGGREEEEESKSEDGTLQEEKEGEKMEKEQTLNRYSNNMPVESQRTDVSSTVTAPIKAGSGQRGNVLEKYGITEQEGSVWVEWLVNCSRGGSISVGAMTAAAANDPDAR